MMQEPAGLVNGQMNEGMVNVLKDLVTKQTTQYLEAEEDRVDDMIKKLDNMDEDDIEKMREVRKRRLKAEAERKHKLRQQGMYIYYVVLIFAFIVEPFLTQAYTHTYGF